LRYGKFGDPVPSKFLLLSKKNFRHQGTSCEVGRVSPLYGFLEENFSLSEKNNSGYFLSGCFGNCE